MGTKSTKGIQQAQNRICTICVDRRRREIDKELQSAVSYGVVAERFRLSKTSLWRHAKKCIGDEISSADASRGAALDDLVRALDRQTKYLRDVLKGRERFKLERWGEWTRANVVLERLATLKLKAFRRSSPSTGDKGSEKAMDVKQASAELVNLFKSVPHVADWVKASLYRAGHTEAFGFLDNIPSEFIVRQLVLSKDLRDRLATCVREADEECNRPLPDSYVIPAGDLQEALQLAACSETLQEQARLDTSETPASANGLSLVVARA